MATTSVLNKYEVQGLCQRYWMENKGFIHNNGQEEEQTVQVIRYKLKPTSDAPTGFLGRHQFLDVKIAINDGSKEKRLKKLRFFLKSTPVEMKTRMQYLEDFGVFKKESLIYRDVLPQIQSIFPGIAPKCYYAANNLLVFEDLASQGYKMVSGRDGLLDYEHLNCSLKCLAALHAGSIVYEVRHDTKFDEVFSEVLKENAYPADFPHDHSRVRNFYKVVDVIKEMVKSIPLYRTQINEIQEKLPNCMKFIFEKAKPSTVYKNVVLHGDLWKNNCMFQYGKHGEIPIQCRLVDFQLTRYAPPMLDVLTLLTIPTSREFREHNLDILIEDYYRFMTEFLKYEGLSIDDYIPKEHIYEGMSDFRLCGLIESCLFSHMTVMPPELATEVFESANGFEEFFDEKRVEICMKAFNSDVIYKTRLSDMIEDLVDRYILN